MIIYIYIVIIRQKERKMGNCRCLDDNRLPMSQAIIPPQNNKNIVDQNKNNLNNWKAVAPVTGTFVLPTKSQMKGTSNQAKALTTSKSQIKQKIQQKKQPTHTPQVNFAIPIDTFPKLSQKIIDTDKNLGEFKASSQIYLDPNIQPVAYKSVYKLHNGIIYRGGWHNGKMNGIGQLYLPDGSYVRGFSANNQLIDEVRYIRQNGDYYQGHIANNKANGKGIKFQKGILYKGNFIDSYLQGKGSQESPDYIYQGEYFNGAKTFGKLSWGLQQKIPYVYEGGFFDEQFNGEGKLVNEIGQYEGRFENGKKKGRGEFRWKTGQKFEGIYENNMKNGQGKIFNTNKKMILEGTWKDDKFVEPT